jgi:hypothetical protein
MKRTLMVFSMALLLAACGGEDDTTAGGGGGGAGGGGGDQLADGGDGGGAGGGGGDPTGCTWSTTGAVVASGDCSFSAAYSSDDDAVAFNLVTSGGLTFGAELVGQTELTAGTYTLDDASAVGGAFNQGTTATWIACSADTDCTDGDGDPISGGQGAFTLTITDPGPSSVGVLWTDAHGTLTATLPADPGTPASGTITATAEF